VITRVKFIAQVDIDGYPYQNLPPSHMLPEGANVQYSHGGRGPGIEIWLSATNLIFVPMSNIAFIEEEF